MRAVVQRVLEASVTVDGERISQIGRGLLVLVGIEKGDTEQDVNYLATKTVGLRVFEDDNGLMNLSTQDSGLEILAVSQFTLLGDVRRGKRPSFTTASPPAEARELFARYCQRVKDAGIEVGQGRFQADMRVALVNDGPVTILLDSRKLF